MNNITTIQVHEEAKRALDRIKGSGESYEEAVLKLIEIVESQKKSQEKLMIEGCKEMAEESLKICNEFKYADAEIDAALRKSEAKNGR